MVGGGCPGRCPVGGEVNALFTYIHLYIHTPAYIHARNHTRPWACLDQGRAPGRGHDACGEGSAGVLPTMVRWYV